MFDQLAALENPVSEDDLVQVTVNGLGTAYRPFVRSLENRLNAIGFDDLYRLLLSEEESLANEISSDISPTVPPTTHFATSRPQ